MRALRLSAWGMLAAALFAGCGDDGDTTTSSAVTATSSSSGVGGSGGAGGEAAGTGGSGTGGGPTAAWSRTFGGGKSDIGRAIAVDPNGEIVVVGHFAETVTFGGGALTAVGGEDIFVLKLDAAGNTLWTRAFGGAEDDEGLDVGIDSAGNVIFVAAFEGEVDFGGGALVGAGKKDLALVKLAPDGTHLWSKRIGNSANDSSAELSVHPSGEIALAGPYKGALSFDGDAISAVGTSDNLFVARVDANGAYVWTNHFNDSFDIGLWPSGVALDADGSVVVTGPYAGSVNFGGGALPNGGSLFVVKLNSLGLHAWSKGYGDGSPQQPNDARIDGAGHILLAGGFEGTVDFGGGPLTSAAAMDIFVTELDSSGAHLASQRYGGALDQAAEAAASGAGKVVLTGTFDGDVNFGGGALTSAGGLGDVLVAAHTSVGEGHVWSASYGDGAVSTQAGYDLAVEASGAVIVTGTFGGVVDFGAGPHQATHVDVFVTKFAP